MALREGCLKRHVRRSQMIQNGLGNEDFICHTSRSNKVQSVQAIVIANTYFGQIPRPRLQLRPLNTYLAATIKYVFREPGLKSD